MIRFVLVGCGRVAQRHAELLARDHISGGTLVGVCDVEETKSRKLGEKYDIPHFTCMHEMVRSVPCDVISILTESGLHASHALELVSYGKHLLVEKPMALTLEDADKMISACYAAGVRLFIVKQNRFNLPVTQLRRAIENGKFGRLILGTVRVRWCRTQAYYDQAPWRGTWAYDGGVLANQASHHIDLLEWMMGDVESVFAMSSTALVDIEAEDTAVVSLRFKSGALGIIEATTASRPSDLEGSLSVLGEHGVVEIAGFAVNELKTWNFTEPTDEDNIIKSRSSEIPPDVYGFGHKAYYNHVVNCINHDLKQLVDGMEGRRSLELISAIYESIETRKEVFLRFKPRLCKLGLILNT